MSFRPQQGLLIMNKTRKYGEGKSFVTMFLSPSGVTYYELKMKTWKKLNLSMSFHPQQGLLIMNMMSKLTRKLKKN